MDVLSSTIDPTSQAFKDNAAAMTALVDVLKDRHALVRQGVVKSTSRNTPSAAN
ncbi:MAG: hypothetical protein R2857_09955 [Vampirovibrionales bacterium]